MLKSLKCVGSVNVISPRQSPPDSCILLVAGRGRAPAGHTVKLASVKEKPMANISQKSIIRALDNDAIVAALVDNIPDSTPEDVRSTIAHMVAKANRVQKSAPSAETLKNRETMRELVGELNARGKEMTAADLADVYADADGMPISPRKIGALLRNAAASGLVAISPEPWSVKHYAPVGFTDWEKKPEKPAKAPKDAEK